MHYFTFGSVRGACPHKHRTPDSARECIQRDDRAVKRAHGPSSYSDRAILVVDGDIRPYTDTPEQE